jgi:N-acetylglucosamine-6-sulfatase
VDDKRAAIRDRPRLTPGVQRDIAYLRAQRRESLSVVDRKIEELVSLVERRGELDDTYFVLTSDNGWMEGQHRIPAGKLQAYEESAGVPLIIRGPGFEPGTRFTGVTGLQDLVPTFLDLAGVALPPGAPEPDGMSLAGLVSGRVVTERAQLVEIADNSRTKGGRLAEDDPPWLAQGVVTADEWKYVEYPGTAEAEMYRLSHDPDELRNLAGRARWAAEEQRLAAILDLYRECRGEGCRS